MNIKHKIIVRSPLDHEYTEYYLLRWKVLRAPWDQDIGSEKDELENESIHRIAIVDGKIIACGRLHFIDSTNAQIRYMAVAKNFIKQGIGKAILFSLEKLAKEKNIQTIILHARESVVCFYEKQNYQVIKKSHLLFDQIQHFEMQKIL